MVLCDNSWAWCSCFAQNSVLFVFYVLWVVGKEEEMWLFCFSCFGKESTNSSYLFFALHGGLWMVNSNWMVQLQEDWK
jgi:hypothetical protein